MTIHHPLALDALVFTRDLVVPGVRASAYRDVERGLLVPVARGVYAPAERWVELSPESRHVTQVRALSRLHPQLVFGATSAALLWGRPLIGRAPARPEVISWGSVGGRSTRGVLARTTTTPFEVEEVGGVPATTLTRALIDAARFGRFTPAVAALDHGLSRPSSREVWPATARVERDTLTAEFERANHVGRARARAALAFADGGAGSPGETLSRIEIARAGFPVPVLQREFSDAEGLIGIVDFFWEECRLIGEFDGHGKYQREELLDGRTPGEAVVEEKRRENRLRALGFLVVRWEWVDIMQPERLRAKLIGAGLRASSSSARANVLPRD